MHGNRIKKRFILVIEPMPGNWQADEIQRLKMFLKTIKRGYGFNCVNVAPLTD